MVGRIGNPSMLSGRIANPSYGSVVHPSARRARTTITWEKDCGTSPSRRLRSPEESSRPPRPISKNGKQLPRRGQTDMSRALVEAAENGDVDRLQQLLDQGVDINSPQENGWTALMAAAAHGHTEAFDFLLGRGADPQRA